MTNVWNPYCAAKLNMEFFLSLGTISMRKTKEYFLIATRVDLKGRQSESSTLAAEKSVAPLRWVRFWKWVYHDMGWGWGRGWGNRGRRERCVRPNFSVILIDQNFRPRMDLPCPLSLAVVNIWCNQPGKMVKFSSTGKLDQSEWKFC